MNRPKLSPYQKDVLNAKICPYCKSKTRLATEKEIYGKKYRGRAIICCVNYPRCDSYVGCHDDGTALGRLAKWSLRAAKIKAHETLDRLWRDKLMDRDSVYEELADHLNIPDEYCHVGMFNENTCNRVRQWAGRKYLELISGRDNNRTS